MITSYITRIQNLENTFDVLDLTSIKKSDINILTVSILTREMTKALRK